MTFLETLKTYVPLKDPWKKKFWDALEKKGLPTKKWDPFRYASLKRLYDMPIEGEGKKGWNFAPVEGAISLPITEAMRSYGPLLQKGYAERVKEETNPFALLNHALSKEGRFLYVPPGKTTSLEWEFNPSEEGRVYSPKVEIFLGKGAHLHLQCRYQGTGAYFHNQQLQLTLEEGAQVELDEHLEHSSEGIAMHTLRAHLKRDAKLTCFTFSKGAKCERHDLQVTLAGENSEVDLKGLSIGNKKDEIHHFITVNHIAPNCRSNQHYKTALLGRARSSFEGKIYVEKEAQKTEAYQLNNNLLLSPKAQAMSKPNLEIFADDVKASHGATCTQPKEEELFYLRARGLSLHEAKGHLARGFCRELMDGEIVDRFLTLGDDHGNV